MQKCTSSWHGGMVDALDLKSSGGKHHTSSSLVASISHMRHFIPWARMIEVGTKMLNFCIYIRVLCEQHEWHMALSPTQGIYILQNGLTVSSVGRTSIAREGHRFESCTVNSTQKIFDFLRMHTHGWSHE